MRILGFSKKWDKLKQPEFTTFRYPRVDRDWAIGEVVQVVYKHRSPNREILGEAKIIKKERRELDRWFAEQGEAPLTTDTEARADGFENRKDMARWMRKRYGLNYISLFNKLTLRWVTSPTNG